MRTVAAQHHHHHQITLKSAIFQTVGTDAYISAFRTRKPKPPNCRIPSPTPYSGPPSPFRFPFSPFFFFSRAFSRSFLALLSLVVLLPDQHVTGEKKKSRGKQAWERWLDWNLLQE